MAPRKRDSSFPSFDLHQLIGKHALFFPMPFTFRIRIGRFSRVWILRDCHRRSRTIAFRRMTQRSVLEEPENGILREQLLLSKFMCLVPITAFTSNQAEATIEAKGLRHHNSIHTNQKLIFRENDVCCRMPCSVSIPQGYQYHRKPPTSERSK